MNLERFFNELSSLPETVDFRVSPNGKTVAFRETGSKGGRICLWSLTEDAVQTTSPWYESGLQYKISWCPQGQRVYYYVEDEHGPDIYALTPSGDVTTIVADDAHHYLADLHPSGEWLLYSSSATDHLQKKNIKTDTAEAWGPSDFSDPSIVARFDHTGERILIMRNPTDDLQNQDLFIHSSDGTEQRRVPVTDTGDRSFGTGWHAEGDRILVTSNTEKRPGIFDLRTNEIDWFGAQGSREYPLGFFPSGSAFATINTSDNPVVYEVDGTRHMLTPDMGCYEIIYTARRDIFFPEDVLLLAQSATDHPPAPVRYDHESKGVQPSFDYPISDGACNRLTAAETVSIPVSEGTVPGLLYPNSEPGPGIVLIYGDSSGDIAQSFDRQAQAFAATGYTVLRAATRGNRFTTQEHDDFAAAGRWLAEQPSVQHEQVGVFGHSHGAHNVLMQLINYPDIWDAGIAWNGVADLHEFREHPDAAEAYWRPLGDPETNQERWQANNPIDRIEELRAPLLLYYGAEDTERVTTGRSFRDELIASGWTEGPEGRFEYVEVEGEGHYDETPSRQADRWTLFVEFFNRRLADQPSPQNSTFSHNR